MEREILSVCFASLVLGLSIFFFFKGVLGYIRRISNVPPAVPGLPLIGNLHQLTSKKPHQTFANWSEIHGSIFCIKTGSINIVVLNNSGLAKEAMVTRFSSISSRKLPHALEVLTANKTMVAMSDYGEFHKMVKRLAVTGVLGANAQKRNRVHRDTMVDNIMNKLNEMIKENPFQTIILREIFKEELFSLALKQTIGRDVAAIYVEEFNTEFSKKEIFDVLVLDPLRGAIDVDWRDFFPYLRWIPNTSFEKNIKSIRDRRDAVTKALIKEQKKRVASGEVENCYLDFILSESTNLTEEQLSMLIWETIIESSDTTLVTTEWAMYELAKHSNIQEKLYTEIKQVCGDENLTEEHLSKLPYLHAVFQETLRKYSPVPIVPLRYAHEDTQLGGFRIPKGTQIAINIYGCNNDKKQWEKPEEWNPERFLSSRYEPSDLYKTMSFGTGKRICAGTQQAMSISCRSIGRFVQEFLWKLEENGEDEDTVQLTTHKLYPMKAVISPRA